MGVFIETIYCLVRNGYFESRQGLVNSIIESLGGSSVNWLGGNPNAILLGTDVFKDTFFGAQWFTSLIVLLVYIVWNSLPFKILILCSSAYFFAAS